MRWMQSKPLPRVKDSINSLSAGLMMQLARLIIGAFEVTSYAWVYEHWRIAELPWDSSLTWWVAFFGVDCGYYWFHRMAHGKYRCCMSSQACPMLITLKDRCMTVISNLGINNVTSIGANCPGMSQIWSPLSLSLVLHRPNVSVCLSCMGFDILGQGYLLILSHK